MTQDFKNARLKGFGPEVVEWLGMGPVQFSPPSGPRSSVQMVESTQKTPVNGPVGIRLEHKSQSKVKLTSWLMKFKRWTSVMEMKHHSDFNLENLPKKRFQPGEDTLFPISRRRSWKKEARRRGNRSSEQQATATVAPTNGQEGASSLDVQ